MMTDSFILFVQAQDVHLKFSVGYELFDLHSHEIIREPALDTKVLIAWGDDTVVVAFRGTASAKNAATDIQVSVPAPSSDSCPVAF